VYLNLAGFLVYATFAIFNPFLACTSDSIRGDNYVVVGISHTINGLMTSISYLMFMIMTLLMFAMAAIVPKIFKGLVVREVSILLGAISLVFMLIIHCFRLEVFASGGTTGARAGMGIAMVSLILLSIYVFYELYLAIDRFFVSNLKKGLVMSITLYTLFHYTLFLMLQFWIGFYSMAVTAAYIVAAFVCIGLGLYMRSTFTRRFAIILAGLSIIKLFIIDTLFLDLEQMFLIINYFIFGIVFLGMSLLYHFFYRRFSKFDPKDKKEESEIKIETDKKED